MGCSECGKKIAEGEKFVYVSETVKCQGKSKLELAEGEEKVYCVDCWMDLTSGGA
jgi:hypothetical protein